MRPFKFQYQKILDLRSKESETSQLRYSEALKRLEDAKALLDYYKEEEIRVQRLIAEAETLDVDQVKSYYLYLTQLRNKQEKQAEVIKAEERNVFVRHTELVSAHKEEKKWVKLSEIKKESFVSNQLKVEQNEMDEISIQKHIIKNRD